jgi:signal transduction histidine kinase
MNRRGETAINVTQAKRRRTEMNLEQVPTDPTASAGTHRQADMLLHGSWLLLARVAWVVVLILTVGLCVARLPYAFAEAQTICASAACSNGSYLTPDQARELRHLGLSMDFYATIFLIWSITLELVYVATGIIIFWCRSDNPMALISSLTLVTFGALWLGFNPHPPLAPLLIVLWLGLAFFNSCCFGLFFYTFPTGRFVPRWSGLLALGWIVYWGIKYLILARTLTNPGLDFAIFVGLLVSIVVTQVYRYRRVSTPLERQQTKWVVFGISLALLGVLAIFTLAASALPVDIILYLIVGSLLYVFLLLIPLSIGLAILRSHLWDIDIIINRTLVYGALTASIVGIYVLVVGYLGALFRTGSNLLISLIAAGLVAVLFQPLRELVQRAVNRLLYGQRDEPYTVITVLSQRLEATLAPDAVLPTIVETVVQALKLPYAAVLLKQDDEFAIAATYGKEPGEGKPPPFISGDGGASARDVMFHLPLVYQRETIGQLLLAPRAPGEDFTPADQRLLNELVRQMSVAAHAVQLSGDLQQSNEHLRAARARLVTTREEERRRLRRDLHDGLGPALAALTLKIGAARKLLLRDPAKVESLLLELNSDIETTVGDIRRLVYNLRPPALDELGLVGAIRERAAHYTLSREADQANDLHIEVEAPEQLPPLPAAIEVAAYRIVQEALTNVVRHAHAHSCHIRLSLDEMLTVQICDDGVGIAAEQRAGVGMQSMHERATELGGICSIEPRASGGTRVLARLPLAKE